MAEGMILKALSGFYYVDDGTQLFACRGRGKFRHEKVTPLVGDRVLFTPLEHGSGSLDGILPRKNEFQRPAVANVDQLVIIVSQAVPATDPFLIDRVISIAERRGCDSVICVNKWDLVPGEDLYLNALEPAIALQTGEISEKLGRGRHTTRHVELYRLSGGALVADTPGFSSFDTDRMELCRKEELEGCFREFAPYLGKCQFTGCSHVKEKGCAVLKAVEAGAIQPSRHASYIRLYDQAKQIPDWAR